MPPDANWWDDPAAVSAAIGDGAPATATANWWDTPTTTVPTVAAPVAVQGIDVLSTAGKSYETLINSKEFLDAGSADRTKLYDQWERKDALARAEAGGYTPSETRAALAGRRRDFTKAFGTRDPLTTARDLAIEVDSGAASIAKTAVALFGAGEGNPLYDVLDKYVERQKKGRSQRAQQIDKEQQREIADEVSEWGKFGIAARQAATSPDKMASFVGQVAPTLAIAAFGAVPASIAGIGLGVGAIKSNIYDAFKNTKESEAMGDTTYAALRADGVDEKVAREAVAVTRQAYSVENAPGLAVGGVMGFLAGRFGAEKAITEMAKSSGMRVALSKALEEGAVKQIAKTAGVELTTEVGQEWTETVLGNVGAAAGGATIDPLQGAAEAAGNAVIAGPFGGATQAATRRQMRNQLDQLNTPPPPPSSAGSPAPAPISPTPPAEVPTVQTSTGVDLVMPAGSTVDRTLGNGDIVLRFDDGKTAVYTAAAQDAAFKAREMAREDEEIAATLALGDSVPPEVSLAPIPSPPAAPVIDNTYEEQVDITFLPRVQEGETPELAALVGYKPAETAGEATARLADAIITAGDPTSLDVRQAVIDGHVEAYDTYLANEVLNGRPTAGIAPGQFALDLQEEIDTALIAKGVALNVRRTRAAAKVPPVDPSLTRMQQGSRLREDGRFLSEAAYLDLITKDNRNGNQETTVQENTAASVFTEAQGIDTGRNDGVAQPAQRTNTAVTTEPSAPADGGAVRPPANTFGTTANQKPARPPRPGAPRPRLPGADETNRDSTTGSGQSAVNQQPSRLAAPSNSRNGGRLPAGIPSGGSVTGVPSTSATAQPAVAYQYTSPVGGNPVVRYNEGTAGYKVVFESSYDRDAYMAQSAKASKSDPGILKAVKAAGITPQDFALYGAKVKRDVQATARAAKGGTAKAPTTITIPALSGVTSPPPAAEIVKKRLGTKQGGAVDTSLLQPAADALITSTRVSGDLIDAANVLLLNQKSLMIDQFDLDAQEFDDASQTAINRETTLKALSAEQLRKTLRVWGTESAKYNNAQGKSAQSINRRTTDEVKERRTASRVFYNAANAYALVNWVPDGNKELRERRVNDIAEINAALAQAQFRLDGFNQTVNQGGATDKIISDKVKAESRVKALTKEAAQLQGGLDLFDQMNETATYQAMLDAAEEIVKQTVGKRIKDLSKKRDAIREARNAYVMGVTAGLSTFDAQQMRTLLEAQFGVDSLRVTHDATMSSQLAVRGIQDQYQVYLPGEFFDLATDVYATNRLPTEYLEDSRTSELNADKITAYREGSRTANRAGFDESLTGAVPPVDILVGIERFADRVAYRSGIGSLVEYLAEEAQNGNTKIKYLPDETFQRDYYGVTADNDTRKAGENNFRRYEPRVEVDGSGNPTFSRKAMRVVLDSGDVTGDGQAAVALYNTIRGTSQKAVREVFTGRGTQSLEDAKGNTGEPAYAPWLAAYRELANATQRGLTNIPAFVIYNQELSDALSKRANMLRSGILEKADGTKLNAKAVGAAQSIISLYTKQTAVSLRDGVQALAFGTGEALGIVQADRVATPYQRAAATILNRDTPRTDEAQLLQRLVDDGVVNLRGTTHLDVSNQANVRRSLRIGAKDAAGNNVAVSVLSRMSAYIEWVQRQRHIATLSIAARTVDSFMKQGATYESATTAYRYAYDETKVGSLTTSAWASNVSFLAASAAEIGSAIRSYTSQPLTAGRAVQLGTMLATGIAVSTALKYALSYASLMIGGADEPDDEKRKAFGSKQQQQRATGTNDTLMLFGTLFSMPVSYNPGIQFDKAIAVEAVKALEGREFETGNVARNMLKSLAGPFGSYRFNAVADSTNPQKDLFLATIATVLGANPVTEAAITAIANRDVFGKDLTENRYARTGDVTLPNDLSVNSRIAGGLSDMLGLSVGEKSVGALRSNFPYLNGAFAALGVNRFVKDDTSQFNARSQWKKEEADIAPLLKKANTERQKAQRAAGVAESNFSFATRERPGVEQFTALGIAPKDAYKLAIYYEVVGNTDARYLDKAGKTRMLTADGRRENDVLYAQAINLLRAAEKQ